MLMLNRLQTRLLHTTPVRHDMRPQLKKLWDNHQANQKPLDKGTALILGAPAVACFALYMWKQDSEVLRPLREAKRKNTAQQ